MRDGERTNIRERKREREGQRERTNIRERDREREGQRVAKDRKKQTERKERKSKDILRQSELDERVCVRMCECVRERDIERCEEGWQRISYP